MQTESDMQAGEQAIESHRHHGHTQFYLVWGTLLILTAVEVFLAYERLKPTTMLAILMGLSLIKAGLIISYFMHLKFEVTRMRRLLMASLVICLTLMCIFFADAFRIVNLGVR